MKLKRRIAILLTLVFLIFSLVILKGEFWTNLITENRFESPKNDSQLKSAGFWPNCPQIYISYDNWSGPPSLPWIQVRSGTKIDPHIIENVTINALDFGSCILIENSKEYFEIKNCTLYNSGSGTYDAGIFLNNVTNGLLIDNNCSDNNGMGITLLECNDTKILENEINNNKDIGIYLTYFYEINGCNNVTISDNTINYNSNNGIRIWNGNSSKISNNIVDNNYGTGIVLVECNYNNITRNSFSNNTYGIHLDNSHNNNVSRNTANNNSNFGIYLSNSNFNNVSWNEARYNDVDGINMYTSNYNTVSYNYLSNNIERALVEENCVINFIRDNIYSNVFYSEPFIIDDIFKGNYTWAQASAQQWWCSGNGTFTNPYVIINVVINGHNSTSGIVIRYSSLYFRIENCTIYNSSEQSDEAGIKLDNTGNGTLIKNNISNNGYYGISLSQSNNNSVLDNNLNLNEVGLSLENSNNNNITGNILNSNQQHGIILEVSSNNTLSSNNLNSCGVFIEYGGNIDHFSHTIDISNKVNNKILYYYINKTNLGISNFSNAGQIILVNCNDSLISNLNISHGSVGLSLNFCNNITVFNITALYNKVYGITLYESEDNNITRNVVNFNKEGLTLCASDNNNLSGNVANYNDKYGIHLFACVNITLTGNNMTECGLHLHPMAFEDIDSHNIDSTNHVNGKHLYYYVDKTFLDPTNFTDAGQIILYNCNDSLISNLDLSFGSSGILMYRCYNNTISNVISSYNTMYGLYFLQCQDSQIRGNEFNNNGEDGIFLYFSCMNNNITENIVANNSGKGIQLLANSKYSNIYYNNFIGNGVNAIDEEGSNNWDDGEIGNYWGDYSGVDLNNDYIGDVNYSISGSPNAYDTKPLMYSINGDLDNDGLLNLEEYIYGNDGYQTNISNPDCDSDGLSDYWESYYGTDPWNNDTDGDNMPDLWETQNSLDANVPNAGGDPDKDLLLNYLEFLEGTNPQLNDTDYDLITDFDEIYGTLGYITNATISDTDGDGLLDGYEYGNYTNPLDPDTDNDLIWDFDEIIGTLGYITSPISNDTDGDKLRDDLEYSYNTNPLLSDTDGDYFNDYDEIFVYNTSATDISWYPMPNLFVSGFFVSPVYEGQPFTLNFTITNNGIWSAEGIIIIIRCESFDLTLYNNTNSPFNFSIDQSRTFLVDCSALTEAGYYVLTLEIDPDNLINEKYSSKDGSLRSDWDDNIEQITMQIIPGEGGDGGSQFPFEALILIISIGAVAIVGISGAVVWKKKISSKGAKGKPKPKLKKEIKVKEGLQKQLANIDTLIRENRHELVMKNLTEIRALAKQNKFLDLFYKAEEKMQNFLNLRLKLNDKIKDTILDLGTKYSKLQITEIIIESEIRDEDLIISTIEGMIHKKEIYGEYDSSSKEIIFNQQKNVEEIDKLMAIHKEWEEQNIGKVVLPSIEKGVKRKEIEKFSVFLSYSTIDSEYFQVQRIVKDLEFFPEIEKVLYWEADSARNIVDYMEDTLRESDIFVLFCSENSAKSSAVKDEWQAAFQLRKKGLIKFIPVFEKEEYVPILLMPLLNVKYTKEDFQGFIQKLYEEILREEF